MKTRQKFASVHANAHNHFYLECHLVDRQTYWERRSAALAEWQVIASYAAILIDLRASRGDWSALNRQHLPAQRRLATAATVIDLLLWSSFSDPLDVEIWATQYASGGWLSHVWPRDIVRALTQVSDAARNVF